MILKKLVLTNFRQFYGENELEFSTDPSRNVTLIHGENGVGKTTILNAILWCLFERLTPDFEQQKDLINHEAAAENITHCRVQVYFIHDGTEYTAQRIYSLGKTPTFRVHKIEDGNFREMPAPIAYVNGVLPKDMAPYFFFHGEGVAAISEGKESEKFRKAVRTILGFTFAECAIEDLNNIRKDYGKKIGELRTKNRQLEQFTRDENRAQTAYDSLSEQLLSAIGETKKTGLQLNGIEEKLGASKNADVRRIKRQMEQIDRRLNRCRLNLRSVNRDRQTLIERYGWAIFGSDLMDQGLKFIDESTLKGRIPAPYQDQFVEDLLEIHQCICGRTLDLGSDEEFRVRSLLETASTGEINQRIMKARSTAANLKGRVKRFLQEIGEVDKQRANLDRDIGFAEKELADCEKRMRGINEEEINRLIERRSRLRSEREKLTTKQGRLKERIAQEEGNVRSARKAAAIAGANNARYARLSSMRDGVEEMIRRCEKRLDEYEDSARTLIAGKVNEFLKQFSRKHYEVRVSESFEFFLARTDGMVVAKSQGEKLLLNLAFVSALIQHARLRQNATGRFLVRGTVAPFVIDAPFGELDETYRKATAELLPPQSEQVVFLLSSSHWTGTVDDAIRNRVAREYVLVSNRRGTRGSKPIDAIRLGSKTIEQSRYQQERDCTIVERVH
ncbi:AAA family ATPase [Candidatus Rariloculus sp.]|uniref:AAA family ATPase n=1 Tax=Candidatus Rariloculus sp. TaxID=3101265 RepID=UPI003D1264EA